MIYAGYKSHKVTPGRITRGRRPGSGVFGYFAGLENQLDRLIGNFESDKEVEVGRGRQRQEKAAKKYVNAKV